MIEKETEKEKDSERHRDKEREREKGNEKMTKGEMEKKVIQRDMKKECEKNGKGESGTET